MINNSFVKNIITLMTGTMVAQLIPVFISPILTRLYTPDEFGIFALYLSIVSILAVIATGRYEIAIMLPKKNRDAIGLMVLSFIIALVVSLLLLFFIALFGVALFECFYEVTTSNWLFIIPLAVLLQSVYLGFAYWSTRVKAYGLLAQNKTAQSAVTGISNLTGVCGFNSLGLILSQFGGQFIATAILGRRVWQNDKSLFSSITKKKLLVLARRYSVFPRVTIWSSLINTIYNNGKFIIFGLIFSSAIIGQLYLTFRVLMMPVSIISSSIADVLFQRTSLMKNEAVEADNMFKNFIVVLLSLMVIALFPCGFLFMFGESLFLFFFGEDWRYAGKYASILSISLFFQFSIAPFCKVFFVVNKNNLYLIWEIIRFALVFVPLIILSYLGFETSTLVWVMSVSISVSYFILIVLLMGFLYDKR